MTALWRADWADGADRDRSLAEKAVVKARLRYLGVRRGLLLTPTADRAARRRGARILHCFADSHGRALQRVRPTLNRTWLDVVSVGGATAIGLSNPTSKTRARQRFERILTKVPRHRTLLFMMGEVDCGYTLWRLAERRSTPVEQQLQRALDSYTGFLAELQTRGFGDIVLFPALPPTIDTYADWDDERNDCLISQRERTRITAAFNAGLQAWARQSGARFLDIEPQFIDPATGLVRAELRHHDPRDYHYAPALFDRIITEQLALLDFT